jgi:hypothetical protein
MRRTSQARSQITAEMVGALIVLISPEQAAAAELDARGISEELAKDAPHIKEVDDKARSLWGKVRAAFATVGGLADIADKIVDFCDKHGTWLRFAWQIMKPKVQPTRRARTCFTAR